MIWGSSTLRCMSFGLSVNIIVSDIKSINQEQLLFIILCKCLTIWGKISDIFRGLLKCQELRRFLDYILTKELKIKALWMCYVWSCRNESYPSTIFVKLIYSYILLLYLVFCHMLFIRSILQWSRIQFTYSC